MYKLRLNVIFLRKRAQIDFYVIYYYSIPGRFLLDSFDDDLDIEFCDLSKGFDSVDFDFMIDSEDGLFVFEQIEDTVDTLLEDLNHYIFR